MRENGEKEGGGEGAAREEIDNGREDKRRKSLLKCEGIAEGGGLTQDGESEKDGKG